MDLQVWLSDTLMGVYEGYITDSYVVNVLLAENELSSS